MSLRSLQEGSRITSSTGLKLTLGKLLNRGGAGCIHEVHERPQQVAKLYHAAPDAKLHERKVGAMLRLSPQLPDLMYEGSSAPQVAWPTELFYDSARHFRGFLMPKLDLTGTIELEYMLQERQARAAGLPLGLGPRVTLAANLSALLSRLHQLGHYAVDLKPTNLRFHKRALYVMLLDCDGFSIQGEGERFRALQHTPEYLAPELQGQALPDSGEAQQDHFALAVIVFRLLNFGLHPFSGRPAHERVPTDIPARIARGCYAYGRAGNQDLLPSPMSCHELLPLALRELFDCALAGNPASRPSASTWSDALKPLATRSSGQLVVCARNASHQHFASHDCGACTRERLLSRVRSAAAVPLKQKQKPPTNHGTKQRRPPRSALPKGAHQLGTWSIPTLIRTVAPYGLPRSYPFPASPTYSVPVPPSVTGPTRDRRFAVLMGLVLLASICAIAAWFSADSRSHSESRYAYKSSQRAIPFEELATVPNPHPSLAPPAPPEPTDTLSAAGVLIAAAQGNKTEYELQMQLLRAQARTHEEPVYAHRALLEGLGKLMETSSAHAEGLTSTIERFRPAREACLRGVRAAPDQSVAWAQLGMSCASDGETTCPVGAFAIAALLEEPAGHSYTSFLDSLLRREISPHLKSRLSVLRARGAMLATLLGGPAYTPEIQALAETLLPEERAQRRP